MTRYILIGQTPVPELDLLTWARWYETSDRRVAETFIGRIRVSTVFLSIKLNCGWIPPGRRHLFETMIFGGALDGCQWRYPEWSDAERGHACAVWEVERNLRRHWWHRDNLAHFDAVLETWHQSLSACEHRWTQRVTPTNFP